MTSLSNRPDTGADLVVDALERYGVTHVFGNPGTTEMPLVRAVDESELEYVLALHEDVAVGMAAGYASTRRYHSHADPTVNPLGFANLHTTPGLAHGLGNLYGAAFAGAPVVVTAGTQDVKFQHEEPILAGDPVPLADQFTKWSAEVKHVDALATMLRRAVRVALTPPTGPVFLALPLNVLMDETDAVPERLGSISTAGSGDPDAIERAAEHLVDSDDLVMVIGDGVARAGTRAVDAVVRLAETSGARVHGEILSAEIGFPTGHDQWLSYLPIADETKTRGLLDAETVVFVGCSTNAIPVRREGNSLVPDGVTCIHVGDDAWQLGKNVSADVSILGDPGQVAERLATLVDERLSQDARAQRLKEVAQRADAAEQRTPKRATDGSMSKADVFEALETAASDAYVVDGAYGGSLGKYEMFGRWDIGPEGFLSNKGSGLGYTLPAATGAAIAEGQRPDPRHVVVVIGDGSYLYYPQTMYTAARAGLDVTVVVLDNRSYRVLKTNSAKLMGGDVSTFDIPAVNFAPAVDLGQNAANHGARGYRVETLAAFEETIEACLSESGPSVLDVLVSD